MPADLDVLAFFGSRLREERLRQGYSQEQLAELAGLDRTYISDIERGSRNLGLQNVAALSKALRLDASALLRPAGIQVYPNEYRYRFDPGFNVDCGFHVAAEDVGAAVVESARILRTLPLTLFITVDLKTQSGIVGAVFAAELARQVGEIPNPIEKGHPDIVPHSAIGATEEELRNYPEGLEIKSTLGNVAKGSGLSAGMTRIDALTGIVWQAHHRDVRSLMGLTWDFVGGKAGALAHPSITGVFYSDTLQEDDWGAISGTTGRNTKVTGMTVSGRRKMAAGAVTAIDDDRYINRYARCLGVRSMDNLTQVSPSAERT